MSEIRARLTTVLLLAAFAGCGEEKTGSFRDASAENLISWSAANPYASDATWPEGVTLVCKPKTGRICGSEGCQSGTPQTYVRLTPSTGEYQRCGGGEPCNDYRAQVSYSGSWANLVVPDSGFMARVASGGDFVEVLTQMDLVYIYHGKCQRE